MDDVYNTVILEVAWAKSDGICHINLENGDKDRDVNHTTIKSINDNPINKDNTIKCGPFNNRNKPENNHVANHDTKPADVNIKPNNTASGLAFRCQANSACELEQEKDIADFFIWTYMESNSWKLDASHWFCFFR